MAFVQCAEQIQGAVDDCQGEQQPDQSGWLASLQSRHGQSAEGDKLTQRDQKNPCHGKDQENGKRQQCVDRTIGHAILTQQHGYLKIHGGNILR